jgi:hypothetical protein
VPLNANPADGKKIAPDNSGVERSALADKWGSALNAGFQVIPSVLIKAQSRLGLDAVDCMIILNLNLHWWRKDTLPYPAPALIARRMGVSRRTIERRLFRLQKGGWVKRLPSEGRDGQPNVRRYDLSGLVQRLQHAAVIAVNQREYRSRAKPAPKSKRRFPSDGSEHRLLGNGT